MVVTVNVNNALEDFVGSFGRYQKIAAFLIQAACLVSAVSYMDVTFLTATPHFWYMYDGEEFNQTIIKARLDRCVSENGTSMETYGAGYWQFDDSQFRASIVSREDLVCDQAWIVTMIRTCKMMGTFVGSLLGGWSADRFGPRKTMIYLTLLSIPTRFISVLYIHYISMAVHHFILGIYSLSSGIICYTLGAELVGRSARDTVASATAIWWSAGIIAITGVAYFATEPRHVDIFGATLVVSHLIILWLIPESPFWLLSRGRHEEAKYVMNYMAKKNNKGPLPKDLVIVAKADKSDTGRDDTCNVTKCQVLICVMRIICVVLVWMATSLLYYGIALSFDLLPGNTFVTMSILAVVELLVVLFLPYTTRSFLGRTGILAILLSIAGVAISLTSLVSGLMRTGLFVVACVASSAAAVIAFVVTAEMSPTFMRNSLMGLGNSMARLGTTVVPALMTQGSMELLAIVFGSASLLALISALCLPETNGRPLPETVLESVEIETLISKIRSKLYHRGSEKVPLLQYDRLQ